MNEVLYKTLIPVFKNKEDMESCKIVKIHGAIDYSFFDNNNSTAGNYWGSEIFFDFQSPICIKKFYIDFEQISGYYNEYLYLYASNDSTNWDVVGKLPCNSKICVCDNNKKYLYYKLRGRSQYGWWVHKIQLFAFDNDKYLIKRNDKYYTIKNDKLEECRFNFNDEGFKKISNLIKIKNLHDEIYILMSKEK